MHKDRDGEPVAKKPLVKITNTENVNLEIDPSDPGKFSQKRQVPDEKKSPKKVVAKQRRMPLQEVQQLQPEDKLLYVTGKIYFYIHG